MLSAALQPPAKICEQKRARYQPPPTYAKWAGKREKRHKNRKRSGLSQPWVGVHITNPPRLGRNTSSEAGPGGEPLGADLKSAIGFCRGWIRLLLNSQSVCRSEAESTLMLGAEIFFAQAVLVPWMKPDLGSTVFVSGTESVLNFTNKILFLSRQTSFVSVGASSRLP